MLSMACFARVRTISHHCIKDPSGGRRMSVVLIIACTGVNHPDVGVLPRHVHHEGMHTILHPNKCQRATVCIRICFRIRISTAMTYLP
jgi:hypothetical protein